MCCHAHGLSRDNQPARRPFQTALALSLLRKPNGSDRLSPYPILVSAGFLVIGLSGNILIQTSFRRRAGFS